MYSVTVSKESVEILRQLVYLAARTIEGDLTAAQCEGNAAIAVATVALQIVFEHAIDDPIVRDDLVKTIAGRANANVPVPHETEPEQPAAPEVN